MEQKYDAIILGTGLKEGIVSALLSVSGKRVLHIDQNNYYGGECASLQLDKLYEYFGRTDAPKPEYGKTRDYNIDLVPKFLLSDGNLIKVIRHANCQHYIQFAPVSGQFVVRDGVIHRVPATVEAAKASKLMSLGEKLSMAALLSFTFDWCDEPKNKSLKCKCSKSPEEATMKEFFNAYKLSQSTQDFIGHAMALWLDDSYLDRPAAETLKRINLYADSLYRFEPYCSSYVYPLYGLGDIPQAFARCCAVWGGTFMLNKPVDEILFDKNGHVKGIRSEKECAYAPIVVGSPCYFPQHIVKTSRIGRGIVLLKEPIPDCVKLLEAKKRKDGSTITQTSAQIILTASQVKGRASDIYITTQGYTHNTAPKNVCLGFVSGIVDESIKVGPDGDHRDQLEAGFEILNRGTILEKFYKEDDVYVPKNKATQRANGLYITENLDATSHFETTVDDALEIFEQIMGKPIDWSKPVRPPTLNENGEVVEAKDSDDEDEEEIGKEEVVENAPPVEGEEKEKEMDDLLHNTINQINEGKDAEDVIKDVPAYF